MTYPDFCARVNEAQNVKDCFTEHVGIDHLAWIAAHGTIRDLRDMSGMSRAAWCRTYHIPVRTVEDWDAGVRAAPDYLRVLIAYTMIPGIGDKRLA